MESKKQLRLLLQIEDKILGQLELLQKEERGLQALLDAKVKQEHLDQALMRCAFAYAPFLTVIHVMLSSDEEEIETTPASAPQSDEVDELADLQ